ELDGGTAPQALWEEAQAAPQTWAETAREAFLKLPRTIRALYVHAYIDRLWNLAATERLSRYGQ
ncbi:unnamed protein product, partial [Effrenium voratum]